ncbi:hypothetical protein Patl1_08640 [Pistacia atlantica]|uniref:Uncharacterized protein n=1 Tax=Pistacia atlantica TaxID=434234 RepID=A0ACC1AIC9_9ROSI|nr:hypothetical protein Patl1_08640 [Pistacia atlantica]
MLFQVNVKTQVVVGDPKEKICEVVENSHADLLVMGSHAFGPIKSQLVLVIKLKVPFDAISLQDIMVTSVHSKNGLLPWGTGEGAIRMFLGSVSNYCANHAACPVVIVKGKGATS